MRFYGGQPTESQQDMSQAEHFRRLSEMKRRPSRKRYSFHSAKAACISEAESRTLFVGRYRRAEFGGPSSRRRTPSRPDSDTAMRRGGWGGQGSKPKFTGLGPARNTTRLPPWPLQSSAFAVVTSCQPAPLGGSKRLSMLVALQHPAALRKEYCRTIL